ncbi:unnamed protein product [Paramecium sonneborni]|uniref:Uncharacterized protein n=1 Tax=Paramecium sonneborni TaxID=65129 RepID=A0A8S1QGF6_9CILI|nr:unnamed protein product [Paramecium sonneborni]
MIYRDLPPINYIQFQYCFNFQREFQLKYLKKKDTHINNPYIIQLIKQFKGRPFQIILMNEQSS